jgi:hypothetical protein
MDPEFTCYVIYIIFVNLNDFDGSVIEGCYSINMVIKIYLINCNGANVFPQINFTQDGGLMRRP